MVICKEKVQPRFSRPHAVQMKARRAFSSFSSAIFARKFRKMNHRSISQDVYGLAESADPIAPRVKEALEVIDAGLDSHG